MKTQTVLHSNFQLVFNSDISNGEILDTEVKVYPAYNRNEVLCVIAGCDIKNFTKEFTELINKYKI